MKKLREVQELETDFSGVQKKKTEAESNLKHAQDEIGELRGTKEFKEIPQTASYREILEMIRALEEEKETIEAEVLAKNSTLRSLETQKSNNSKKRNRVEADIGKCAGEKARNEREKTELARKLREVCHKYGFSSSSAGAEGSRQDMTLGEMEELIDNLSGMLKVILPFSKSGFIFMRTFFVKNETSRIFTMIEQTFSSAGSWVPSAPLLKGQKGHFPSKMNALNDTKTWELSKSVRRTSNIFTLSFFEAWITSKSSNKWHKQREKHAKNAQK